jgi:hypothetical protein
MGKSPGKTWAKMQSYPATRAVSASVNRNGIKNEMQTTKRPNSPGTQAMVVVLRWQIARAFYPGMEQLLYMKTQAICRQGVHQIKEKRRVKF